MSKGTVYSLAAGWLAGIPLLLWMSVADGWIINLVWVWLVAPWGYLYYCITAQPKKQTHTK